MASALDAHALQTMPNLTTTTHPLAPSGSAATASQPGWWQRWRRGSPNRSLDAPALDAIGHRLQEAARHWTAHVGLAQAIEPYTMVRTDLPGSYFLACFRGEGRIWLDGRWQRCRAGQACLSPAHVLCAFHAVPGHRWDFVWVRYEASAGRGPLGAAGAPVLAGFPSEVFRHAVEGLMAEQAGEGRLAALHHWVELVQGYISRFAQPWHIDDRLSQLWEAVAAKPAHAWKSLRDNQSRLLSR